MGNHGFYLADHFRLQRLKLRLRCLSFLVGYYGFKRFKFLLQLGGAGGNFFRRLGFQNSCCF